jgi:carbonic anhydrase/SulP family sulfate permease
MTTARTYLQAAPRDALAGLVVFLVAVPLCLGIAHASGAPIISGVLSGIIGGIVVGLLSGSHVSVSGPAAGLTAIVLAQVEKLQTFEAFLLAVALSGILQLGLGMLRAGLLAAYVPTNVIRGLLAAIGVILIMKQIPHLVGHDTDYEGNMSFAQTDGFNTFSELSATLGAFLPGAAIVGLSCLALLLLWQRSPLKHSIFPAPLAAVLLGVGLNELFALAGSSWTISASHLVQVPVFEPGGGLDGILRTPDWSQWSNPAIYVAAVTLAVVASLEALINLEATDRIDPLKRTSPPNRELLAQGVGNLTAGLIGGLPVTSVVIRSSVNTQMGARTKASTVVHGVLLLVSVFLLPQALNRIPLAALAAILIVTGWKLAHPRLFRQMYAEGLTQFLPFVVTVVAIVFTDLLVGVLIGLGVSFCFILHSNLQRGFHVIREKHVGGEVVRLELADQVSFLNRARLATTLAGLRRETQVVIDARNTDYIDPDILALITEFRDEQAPNRDIGVSLIGFRDRYPLRDEIQYVDVSTRDVQKQFTPADVLRYLKEGNERFVSGKRLHRDLVRQVDATADGQHPIAVILACIDSRIATELVFDLGLGDIFSVRLAGNVVDERVLGSMEFACKVAGAKLILVLGHTRCGAVKATCDFAARGVDPIEATGLTNLPALTERIGEAVRMERTIDGDRSSANEEFVDRVARLNVENMMQHIRLQSPALREMLDAGEIGLEGAMYDVRTGVTEFFGLPPEEQVEVPRAAARA